MKKFILLSFLSFFLLSLNSCYVNRHTVGDGPVMKADAARYSHAKQVYLFWGLIPLGHATPTVPTACGYQLKTSFNFIDLLIHAITGGIVGTRNMKILVTRNGNCDPKAQRADRKASR